MTWQDDVFSQYQARTGQDVKPIKRKKRIGIKGIIRRAPEPVASVQDGESFLFEMLASVPPSVNHIWRYGRNGRVYKTRQAKEYQAAFGFQARQHGFKLVDGALKMSILLIARPGEIDCDNSFKLILDALQGIAYHNDSQVWELQIKRVIRADGQMPHIRVRMERFIPTEATQDIANSAQDRDGPTFDVSPMDGAGQNDSANPTRKL